MVSVARQVHVDTALENQRLLNQRAGPSLLAVVAVMPTVIDRLVTV